jgi:hypothetical protein
MLASYDFVIVKTTCHIYLASTIVSQDGFRVENESTLWHTRRHYRDMMRMVMMS